ncbi:hypothetical protein F8M41_014272 [Gigaspora margarita]|uniref:Uncharacterized protein n=1 Tax=Gigaspora margarita TaxID=4874 RepID=A0A8H4ARS1_GIGMA|nr:hypothetical protein F8M41_014272 [Gigaspora margarita]
MQVKNSGVTRTHDLLSVLDHSRPFAFFAAAEPQNQCWSTETHAGNSLTVAGNTSTTKANTEGTTKRKREGLRERKVVSDAESSTDTDTSSDSNCEESRSVKRQSNRFDIKKSTDNAK